MPLDRAMTFRCARGHFFVVDENDLKAGLGKGKWKAGPPLPARDGPSGGQLAFRDKLPSGTLFSQFLQGKLKGLDAEKFTSSYPKGTVLFVEGQASRGVFIVYDGQVKLSINSREGKTLILWVAEPGEILGLLPVLSGTRHEYTAETLRPSKIAFVPRALLLRYVTQHPQLYQAVMQQIGAQYRDTCEQLRNFGLSATAPQRLAKLLLKFALGVESGRNRISIDLPLSHERLAEYLGTSRETVTRILNDFKKRRLIDRQGSTLLIKDRQALEKLAQTE